MTRTHFFVRSPIAHTRTGERLYKPSNRLAKAAIATGHDPEDHEGCKALASVLSQVGDKWTILVVGVLSLGSSRFNALQRAVPGISHRMLTHTLRGLERDGLVKRTSFAEIPPRVEYELTLLGRSLTTPLAQLAGWASANQSSIESSRLEFDTLHRAAPLSGSIDLNVAGEGSGDRDGIQDRLGVEPTT